jgi:hypothetical protein
MSGTSHWNVLVMDMSMEQAMEVVYGYSIYYVNCIYTVVDFSLLLIQPQMIQVITVVIEI